MWVSDYQGNARGIDPVFDLFEYCELTNQVYGNMTGFTIAIEGQPEVGKLKWLEFKELVLAEVHSTTRHRDTWKGLGFEGAPVKLYGAAERQNRRQESQKLLHVKIEKDHADDATGEEPEE